MEQRFIKLSKRKAGGTAGNHCVKYAVNIPSKWVKALCGEENMLELTLDGEQIIIKKSAPKDVDAFLKRARNVGHLIRIYHYMNRNTVCSKLYLDCTAQQICVENEAVPLIETAFGVNQSPTWKDLEEFFTSRCVPEARVGLEYYLQSIGLREYDSFAIVEKTQGRMAEDNKWLKKI